MMSDACPAKSDISMNTKGVANSEGLRPRDHAIILIGLWITEKIQETWDNRQGEW